MDIISTIYYFSVIILSELLFNIQHTLTGFNAGSLRFDDENTNNQNELGGDAYPSGVYGKQAINILSFYILLPLNYY